MFCIEEKKIQSYIESHRRDFASTLKNCQTLYRLIDSLKDDNMRENVVKLDTYFSQKDIICYFYGGRILDGLIKKSITTRQIRLIETQLISIDFAMN